MHFIVIKGAEDAYKEREVIKEEIRALKEADEKEELEYQKQWQELKQLIEKDKQIRDYLETQQELSAKDTNKDIGKALKQTPTKTGGISSRHSEITGSQNNDQYKSDNLNELVNTEKMLRK